MQWKDSMDVRGSSWNHWCWWRSFIFKSAPSSSSSSFMIN